MGGGDELGEKEPAFPEGGVVSRRLAEFVTTHLQGSLPAGSSSKPMQESPRRVIALRPSSVTTRCLLLKCGENKTRPGMQRGHFCPEAERMGPDYQNLQVPLRTWRHSFVCSICLEQTMLFSLRAPGPYPASSSRPTGKTESRLGY